MSEAHVHVDPSNKKVALFIAVLALVLAFAETLGKGSQTSALASHIEPRTCGPSSRRRPSARRPSALPPRRWRRNSGRKRPMP